MNKQLLQRISDYLRDGEDDYEEISAEIEKELAKTEPEPEPVGEVVNFDTGNAFNVQWRELARKLKVGDKLYTTQPDQSARIAELEQQLSSKTDESIDKILAMTDEQVTALQVMEGHNPDDVAKLGKLTFEIASLKTQLAELQKAHDAKEAVAVHLKQKLANLTAERDALQAKLDGGVRVCATKVYGGFDVSVFYPHNTNATLILDKGE